MSLFQLISNDTVLYYAPEGQNAETGAAGFDENFKLVKCRFSANVSRYSTQEARDIVYDASITTFEKLEEQGKIEYNGQNYLISEKFEIRKGNSAFISHYNYFLRNYDQA